MLPSLSLLIIIVMWTRRFSLSSRVASHCNVDELSNESVKFGTKTVSCLFCVATTVFATAMTMVTINNAAAK